jgi:predicted RNA-binding Zn-ribbon protein involved in translation (DUF1610 family)
MENLVTYYDKAKCSNCNHKANVQSVSGYFIPHACPNCGCEIMYVYNDKEDDKDKDKDKKPKWIMQVVV